MESAQQNVLRVEDRGLGPGGLEECVLNALSTRVLRQHDMVEELVFGLHFDCTNKQASKAWATLVEKSNSFSAPGGFGPAGPIPPQPGRPWITIGDEEIGADGWAAVRRIAEHLSTATAAPIKVFSKSKVMGEGRREDLEAIWKVASRWGVSSNEGIVVRLHKTEDGRPGCWGPGGQLRTGMDQIMDIMDSMTKQEWMEASISGNLANLANLAKSGNFNM